VRAGGKAQRPGAHAVLDDVGHLLDVFGGRDRAGHLAVTEHIGAHCAVRHVGADIDRARQLFQRIKVFGEGFPVPLHPFGQRRAGNILYPFHQPDQPIVPVRRGRSKADAAVAHDHGGHAVPAGRGHFLVPGGLAIIVRVHIDPARGDDLAGGVDLARGAAVNRADGGDQAVLHRDIAGKARRAGAVDNGAITDDQIIGCHGLSPFARLSAGSRFNRAIKSWLGGGGKRFGNSASRLAP
jgi:hypothetical protein